MDKIINSHIDILEELELQLDKIIAQEIAQVDIDALVINPKEELTKIVLNIRDIFLDQYGPQAIEYGLNFAKKVKDKIEADKTIKVDDSENSKLNAED